LSTVLRIVLLPAAFALALTGCSFSSPYMRPAPQGAAFATPPDHACVVFVRPSGLGAAVNTTILDEEGRFLGDAQGHSHFVVCVPQGKHLFISWAENTDVLEADLLEGRTYYVLVDISFGLLSPRVHLLAMTPRNPNWSRRETWVGGSRPFIPDVAAGEAYLRQRSADVADRLQRARQNLVEMSAEDRELHTLTPADGI